MMKRRQFIAGLGSAVAWPTTAWAQQSALPVVGLVHPGSPEAWRDHIAAFHRGLADSGFVEGRNVKIEYRWAYDDNRRLPALIADLIDRHVAVIATPNSQVAGLVAKEATRTIPIVFMVGSDPVESGLVAALGRPGGNATGVTLLNVEMAGRRLQMLHEIVPAARIANLRNPTNTSPMQLRETTEAARALGLSVLSLHAATRGEIETAFETLVREGGGALVVAGDPFLYIHRDLIVALAARHAVPTIYAYREFAEAGGLVSYGADPRDAVRLVGAYTGRILKGEKPADLPVQQVTRIEMVLNLKTAKALGLTIPLPLLGRADEVIE
jgi:putative ABC transport system substrate-binding protein